MRSRAQEALRLSGVFAWLSVLALLWAGSLLGEPGPWSLEAGPRAAWFAAFFLFGAAYWGASAFHLDRARRLAYIVLLSACAALCAFLSPSPAVAMLFILTAALLPGVAPWPLTLGWTLLHSAVLALALLRVGEVAPALRVGLTATVGQVAAALLVHLTGAEMRARRELGELNVQLRFTRALLEDATRGAERARISRELHDALGHHLTVLGLELEFAAHLAGGEAREAVERARALNRLLLAEVRATVGALREGRVEWDRLTRDVLAPVPGLNVHVALSPDLGGAGAGCTQAVLRFMQEVVTNAVRHAGARNVWFELERGEGGALVVRARDDGGLRGQPTPGHGLSGLRERFEELGGTFHYGPGPGGGLHLEARVPLESA